MPGAQPSSLVSAVSQEIVRHIQETNLEPGARLVERQLGEKLRVSRSPIRKALQLLEEDGLVCRATQGGFVVGELPVSIEAVDLAAGDDERYLRIASDRLDGRLPDKVTETFLLREYDLTRTELNEILRRISKEGWIERLPGYGWEFLPMLDSLNMYRDSYRFRLIIEPAGIVEPTFALDRAVLLKCREEQQRLVDGEIWTVSNAELFDYNSSLHESIMNCSNNSFLSESLRRVDKLRRLIEYKKSLPRERALERCREHLVLLDLLLDGHLETASSYMREHLTSVSFEKTSE